MHILTSRFRYFLRCAECGSIKAAARELGLTQAALSIALRKLEEELGASLFERRPRGLDLTPRGRALFSKLNAAQAALTTDVERAVALPDGMPLKIGAAHHFGAGSLLPYLSRREHELGTLHVVLSYSLTVYEAVREGRLDFGFVAWTEKPKHLRYIVIQEDPVAFMGLRSRFPELERIRSERDLERFPLVNLPRPQYPFDRFFYPNRNCFVAGHAAPFCDMIMAGVGVGRGQPSGFSPKQRKRLALAPISARQEIYIYLVHRPDISRRVARLVNEFAEWFKASH